MKYANLGGGSGGMPPRKCLKIRPFKGESESICNNLSVENNGISVYYMKPNLSFFVSSILLKLV